MKRRLMFRKRESLSKAVGPWRQKPQTHTNFFFFCSSQKNQNKSSSMFTGEKLQSLRPVVRFHVVVRQGGKSDSIIIS